MVPDRDPNSLAGERARPKTSRWVTKAPRESASAGITLGPATSSMTRNSRDQHDHTASTTGNGDERGSSAGPNCRAGRSGDWPPVSMATPTSFPSTTSCSVAPSSSVPQRAPNWPARPSMREWPSKPTTTTWHRGGAWWSRAMRTCCLPVQSWPAAERAQVLPWVLTPKQRFIRIEPTEITGRRFQFGVEPEHLYDFG